MLERVYALFLPVGICMYDEFNAPIPNHLVAKGNHLFEFPSGVDVQEGEGNFAG